ncbi:L-proline dehydrogenase [Rubritalea squalenifaciens DSM 18772]|uniref:L-glutamate gamma-semialdehyde dehydrogenase n=1 Tax=Rubritalea squalenifaciens DSM 18772 TaxID=1123071 RepID=A0A1M6I7H8_9BACT|nr:proline dehydrogenase family protein [Rubritalea squalenifaciens]SHJ30421.1 L-proline dehydrogenase [Rubritalea squalenifaciens DSM 18772]
MTISSASVMLEGAEQEMLSNVDVAKSIDKVDSAHMSISSVSELLETVKQGQPNDNEMANAAVQLAELILKNANKRQKLSEKYQAWKMARMMNDPRGKALTLAMADQVFRPANHARSANQMRYLIEEYGIPEYLPIHEQIAMRIGATVSQVAPDIVMPAVTTKMRAESDQVILPSEDAKLKPHLAKRKKQSTRMNINQLGEAILGEEEAAHRMQQVIDRLKSPDCEYISVKISAIFSQINLVAYDYTLEEIKKRLRELYRVAKEHTFVREDGSESPKFVNLDMEEYRDLRLTCDAFCQVLDEEEFQQIRAGIVLQAYLPDSFKVQQSLTEWAKKRVSEGMASIKVRIVKGANLAMETVDASVHDWPLATYYSKKEVDANFKRMVHYGCEPENAKAVQLGIASHNLFEVSYSMLVRAKMGVEEYVEFEMLEGMANHQARAVQDFAGGLLRYAPVVKKEDFHSAISYLVRRLDENTHEENFLHDIFGMTPGGQKWNKQKKMFLDAHAIKDEVKDTPNRVQDRNSETFEVDYEAEFENSPDTDWSLLHNQRWIMAKIDEVKAKKIATIPLQIGGEEVLRDTVGIGVDPSKNEKLYEYSLADADDVQKALDVAEQAQPAWEARSIEERAKILKDVAVEIGKCRGESIAIMVMEAGKAAPEGDAEVSEAIDFATYYADSLSWDGMFDGTQIKALGTVVITPPWNFPYAIPCGGVLAALMAGNTVIMKPAPESTLTAWVMVQQLWRAGVPRDVLQFLPCPDNEIGRSLVSSDRVGAVVLTGAYETGRLFQGWKPKMRLYAETSGKNSLIITNAADPDQAIKDLVKSAFNHSGQKCSAASLAIIEADVYDNPAFIRQLRDAAASLRVGQSWDPSSIVTPVMVEPETSLYKALTTLEEGEEWLLEPVNLEGNPRLWSPGIKLGVKPGSWYHRTECFGPVLGLIRAKNLEDAIRIQNDSSFGLTGGIHTLDDREIKIWRERVEVGNAYINRPITGAIVRRQPFGGWKNSCFGPGAKAGGPNYVSIFGTWTQEEVPTQLAKPSSEVASLLVQLSNEFSTEKGLLESAAGSFAKWWNEEYSIEHDPTGLHGETNHFRYVPLTRALLRADKMSDIEIAIAMLAAKTAGVEMDISLNESKGWVSQFAAGTVTVESEDQLINRLPASVKVDGEIYYSSLRAPGASEELYRAANDTALQLIDWDVLANGRVELMHFFREQSISECTHRYGNIIPKADSF